MDCLGTVNVWIFWPPFFTVTVRLVVPAGIFTNVGLNAKSLWSISTVPPVAVAVPWLLTLPDSFTGGFALLATVPNALGATSANGTSAATIAIPPMMTLRMECSSIGVRVRGVLRLSLIHISEPTRLGMISYAVFCLKKKKKK